MLKFRGFTYVALVLAMACPRPGSAADSTAIAQLVSRFHAEGRFNGSVLVAAGDEVIFEGGVGEADRTWHVPNRPDTVFLIGSVSKQFTSMLVLQLVAEGELGLDDPLSKYLPDYPADKAGLTIHQLLTHSSGLPHYGGLVEIDVDLDDYLRLDRPISAYVELIGRTELDFEPGTDHSYSSLGYIILGHLAELVTGKSFGQLLEERIAAPLGVDDLGFAYNNEPVERLAHGYEYSIRKDGERGLELTFVPEPYRDQSNKYGTGGVHASVRALFRWARAIVSDQLLEAALRDRMFTPQAENYGYGWRIDPGEAFGLPDEVEVISHGGSLSGYRAGIRILDRGRYTIVALGNSDSSRSPALADAIARLLLGADPGPANIFGTEVAWRMVRDGEEVATSFFQEQHEAGVPDYFDNDFAFYAYAEQFIELGRHDLGLALARLGLAAHPESPMLQLAVALSQRGLGEPEAALAAAESALRLLAEGGDGAGFVEEHARELVDELAAETRPMAVGE
jgi:CubicO group peptidase (beta-lactamase class C family)